MNEKLKEMREAWKNLYGFIVQMDRFVRGDRKFHRIDRQRIFLCDCMGDFV